MYIIHKKKYIFFRVYNGFYFSAFIIPVFGITWAQGIRVVIFTYIYFSSLTHARRRRLHSSYSSRRLGDEFFFSSFAAKECNYLTCAPQNSKGRKECIQDQNKLSRAFHLHLNHLLFVKILFFHLLYFHRDDVLLKLLLTS